jgi:hypothetical protein
VQIASVYRLIALSVDVSFRCRGSLAHLDIMSVSIRDLIGALAVGTIVYRLAIVDGNECGSHDHCKDARVGILERLYRLRFLMQGILARIWACPVQHYAPRVVIAHRHDKIGRAQPPRGRSSISRYSATISAQVILPARSQKSPSLLYSRSCSCSF